MQAGPRFKYIAHGKFVEDCILEKPIFLKLVDLIRADLEQVLLAEQQLSVDSNGASSNRSFSHPGQVNHSDEENKAETGSASNLMLDSTALNNEAFVNKGKRSMHKSVAITKPNSDNNAKSPNANI